jgi:putative dimethyl sulfoxide reductase chaperone
MGIFYEEFLSVNIEETQETATLTRADVFRLLAACFYQPEKEIFAEDLVCENLLSAVQHIFPDAVPLAEQLAAALHATRQEELLLDYSRLFLGPFEPLAYPYGSIYLDGQKAVMGDSTLVAKAYYAKHGMEIDEDSLALPDHIAVELEFIYLLTFREEQARQADDPAAIANAVDARRNFVDEHLGQWISPFADKVIKYAETDFYRLLAELTAHCVTTQASMNHHR